MKIVIFAGGLGSRISEESHLKPKPMIEIGNKPILWHIMKTYQFYGFNEFIICLGYKGYVIKEYFANYFLHNSDVTFHLDSNTMKIHKTNSENMKVTLVDTGRDTLTAGRLKRIKNYIKNDMFMLTYGDGLSDINLLDLLDYHKKQGKMATVTAIQPAGKFGVMNISKKGMVNDFIEKPDHSGSWINGGYFVLNKKIFDHLDGLGNDLENTMWEETPLKKLALSNQLAAYHHNGFWKSMDTLRDKVELEEMWKNNPQWKVWK